MSEIKRSKLFGKLNPICYQAAESAAVFCKMRGNPYIELVHWLHQLIQNDNADLALSVRAFDIDPGKLSKDIVAALDRLPRGATSISDFSPHLEQAVERGWLYASMLFEARSIRSGHLLIGMLKTDTLRSILLAISGEFKKIEVEKLTDEFDTLLFDSAEVDSGVAETSANAPGESSEAFTSGPMGKGEALKTYTTNLTEEARAGRLDPVIGRDTEIRQMIDILMRRRQNNPLLVGEAGVGKTAVVEGFALKIAANEVPPSLADVNLHSLDLGRLQAGASMKGEFENRLKQLIEEVQSSTSPVILFIDEAHTLIGAGGAAGQGDAANLLKPALARGQLRTVAATTWKEYKKYIEKDPALTRRFQTILIDEPDDEKCVQMVRGLAAKLGAHHNITIFDEALEAAVTLSRRYLPDRQLPDKAISLLDTACARVAVSLHAPAASLEDARRKVEFLETEAEIARREATIGKGKEGHIEEVEEALAKAKAELQSIEAKWTEEKELARQVVAARNSLIHPELTEKPVADSVDFANSSSSGNIEGGVNSTAALAEAPVDALAQVKELDRTLETLQGERPMVFTGLDAQVVASVISDWTGIPAGRMVRDDITAVLDLITQMEKRVVGQRAALQLITKRIQTNRAGLDRAGKPIGVFMLVGPSGTGKTETALTLAETLYGGERNLITINMSEFQEAHTVSTLKGSPPGYVGYGEGGILTEAVRRKPYSVVLLDEVEKAHPDVHEIFFQVFDKGVLQDGEGRMIDFKNTIILLTSNVGSDLIMNMCKDPELLPDVEGLSKVLRPQLLETFPAALLGRLNVAPYFPLSDEVMEKIIRLQFSRIKDRLQERHGIELKLGDDAVGLVQRRCTEVESGGRMVEAIIVNHLLPAMSEEILRSMLEDSVPKSITVSVKDENFTYSFE